LAPTGSSDVVITARTSLVALIGLVSAGALVRVGRRAQLRARRGLVPVAGGVGGLRSGVLALATVGCCLVLAVCGWLAVAVVPAGLVAGAAWRRTAPARRGHAYEAALPAVVDDMARSIRAGANLALAVADAGAQATGADGPAADAAKVARRVAAGTPINDAFRSWAEERPLDGVRLLTAAVGAAHQSGGPLLVALDAAASAQRAALAAREAARTTTTQARTSAACLAVLPVLVTTGAAAVDPSVAAFVRTPAGASCVGVGAVLDALGIWVMVRLERAVMP